MKKFLLLSALFISCVAAQNVDATVMNFRTPPPVALAGFNIGWHPYVMVSVHENNSGADAYRIELRYRASDGITRRVWKFIPVDTNAQDLPTAIFVVTAEYIEAVKILPLRAYGSESEVPLTR